LYRDVRDASNVQVALPDPSPKNAAIRQLSTVGVTDDVGCDEPAAGALTADWLIGLVVSAPV
jgi:hypothetical protein